MAGGLMLVDITLIDDDPHNPRGDVGNVDDLAQSFAQDGQQNPVQLIAKPNGRWHLHEGHRRKKAALELGEPFLKAIERRFSSDLDRIVSQGAMHTHARDWDPMAWARYLYALFSDPYNLNREQIAHRIGRPPVWVRDTMSFVHLTNDEQIDLAAGRMSRTEALRRLANRRAIRDGKPLPAPKQRRPAHAVPHIPAQRRPAPAPAPAEPYLNAGHRLADQVAARCTASAGHTAHPRIGGVGCGICWEAVIAADAVALATGARQLVTAA